ncbi:hypothetical protein ACVMBZ_001976 [Bradyrhizobium liaoningense]
MAKITRKPAPRKAAVPKKKAKTGRDQTEGAREEIAQSHKALDAG